MSRVTALRDQLYKPAPPLFTIAQPCRVPHPCNFQGAVLHLCAASRAESAAHSTPSRRNSSIIFLEP